MNEKNISNNHTLVEYKKKFSKCSEKLKVYSELEIKNNENLLDKKKWWLIDGNYYEIPKFPSRIWFINLPKAIKISSVILLCGGVATAIAVPIVINLQSKIVEREYKIVESCSDFVNFKHTIDKNGNAVFELTSKLDTKKVIGIKSIIIDSYSLANSEYTFDASNGRVTITKEIFDKHQGNISVYPILFDLRDPIFEDANKGKITNVTRDENNGDTVVELEINPGKIKTIQLKIGEKIIINSEDYYTFDATKNVMKIHQKALNEYSKDSILINVFYESESHVYLDYSNIVIYSNDKTSFYVPYVITGTDKITWKSDKSEIANVDDDGKITISNSLTQDENVIITATTSGNSAKCNLNIKYVTSEDNYLTFEKYNEGDCYIVSVNDKSKLPEELTLPTFHDGKYVSIIKNKGFENCSNIKTVNLPDSIISIGEEAFYGSEVTNIRIPRYTKYIGKLAFASPTKDLSIYFNDLSSKWKFVEIGDPFTPSEDPKYNAKCLSVTYQENDFAKLGTTIDKLSYFATSDETCSIGCDDNSLSGDVKIPETQTINGKLYKVDELTYHYVDKKGAFYNCDKITSITISSTIESIGFNPFEGCTGLTQILVDTNNKYFESSNDLLYSKGQKELLSYPLGKTDEDYIAPETLENINVYVFGGNLKKEGNKNIKTLDLSKSKIQTFGKYCFANMKALTTISIPDSLKTIGSQSFSGCTSLNSFKLDENSSTLETIEGSAFVNTIFTTITFPSTLKYIGSYAFNDSGITSTTFKDQTNWAAHNWIHPYEKKYDIDDLSNASTNATNLKNCKEEVEEEPYNWGNYIIKKGE